MKHTPTTIQADAQNLAACTCANLRKATRLVTQAYDVMDRTTLTRNLKPLVRDGLIDIVQESDQRVRNVTLTENGKASFEDARPHWERVQSAMVEKLGSARWSGLLEDLGATITTLRDG